MTCRQEMKTSQNFLLNIHTATKFKFFSCGSYWRPSANISEPRYEELVTGVCLLRCHFDITPTEMSVTYRFGEVQGTAEDCQPSQQQFLQPPTPVCHDRYSGRLATVDVQLNVLVSARYT